MTMEMTPSGRGGRAEHEPRQEEAVAAPAVERYRLVIDDIERYRVIVDGVTVGFVDVVGTVFVGLSGPRYAHAVEVHQSLVLEDAVLAVLARH